MGNLEILPFSDQHIEEAAALFVKNFKRQRLSTPLLPEVLEHAQNVAELLAQRCRSSNGLAAILQGRVVGYLCWYLVDHFRATQRKGAYVPEWGHACVDEGKAKIYAALYRRAGELWSAAGCQVHAVTCLADDQRAVETWFWNGFGLTVVDAIRPMQALDIPYKNRLTIRKAGPADAGAISRLDRDHLEHYTHSPVFMPAQSEISAAKNLEFLSLPRNSLWLAEDHDELVGFLRFDGYNSEGVAVFESHDGIRIAGAYVRPAYRGQKIAIALLDRALQDYQAGGLKFCTVDFESFNPEAIAFWPKYFAPVCLSVLRVPES